jgi:uncharacterized protein YukE
MKFLNRDQPSLRDMLKDLRSQQAQLVGTCDRDQEASDQRITAVLTGLEECMAKLETIVKRLDTVAETLVEQHDAQRKPWYVRIFCPW